MYILQGLFKEDDRVQAIDSKGEVKEGRIFRITNQSNGCCLISVLPDDKGEVVVVQYKNKINKF